MRNPFIVGWQQYLGLYIRNACEDRIGAFYVKKKKKGNYIQRK